MMINDGCGACVVITKPPLSGKRQQYNRTDSGDPFDRPVSSTTHQGPSSSIIHNPIIIILSISHVVRLYHLLSSPFILIHHHYHHKQAVVMDCGSGMVKAGYAGW